MIETESTFQDSGFDCDHCGGQILIRIDFETGQPDRKCYQCEECSCQWTMDNQVLRVGRRRECRTAQRSREAAADGGRLDDYSRWVLAGLGILAALLLLRFGGAVALRLLIPLSLLGLVVFVFMRYGRQQDWWRN